MELQYFLILVEVNWVFSFIFIVDVENVPPEYGHKEENYLRSHTLLADELITLGPQLTEAYLLDELLYLFKVVSDISLEGIDEFLVQFVFIEQLLNTLFILLIFFPDPIQFIVEHQDRGDVSKLNGFKYVRGIFLFVPIFIFFRSVEGGQLFLGLQEEKSSAEE